MFGAIFGYVAIQNIYFLEGRFPYGYQEIAYGRCA